MMRRNPPPINEHRTLVLENIALILWIVQAILMVWIVLTTGMSFGWALSSILFSISICVPQILSSIYMLTHKFRYMGRIAVSIIILVYETILLHSFGEILLMVCTIPAVSLVLFITLALWVRPSYE